MVPGSMIVNSSRGGGSKDTWVLEDGGDDDRVDEQTTPVPLPPSLPDLTYSSEWSSQQQQQQQETVDAEAQPFSAYVDDDATVDTI